MMGSKRVVRFATRQIAAKAGYDVVRRDFYSPLPDVDRLPSQLWGGKRETPGVDLRIPEALTLLEALRPHIAAFPASFPLDNGTYESVDAEVLYAILRHFAPEHVIELGSGASSHVIAAAVGLHTIFDPFPFVAGSMGPVDATVHRQRTEDIPLTVFDELRPGDVLFVDTTHTVKTGGDVVRLVLDVFPRLRPGVLVHLHDIFLPYEYPRDWVVARRRAWGEQYLLQAFLAFNRGVEVVFPAHALAREHAATVADVVRSFRDGVCPGAFWMRRV